jgi:hypothetical protein
MGKTKYERMADNNWKKMLEAEQRRNAKHKAKKEENIEWRLIYLNKKHR